MKRNIFEVNEEEKRRILEMHIDATNKLYLKEQLEEFYRAKKDWPKIANLLISYGATCYIQEDNLGKRTKTSSGTKLYNEGQTKPTYCILPLTNVAEKVNDPNYKQYSTYINQITFSQHGYYQKTVRGYNGGSGYYSLSNDRKNLIDNNTNEQLITATSGGQSKCPFKDENEILGFRIWLNTKYPEIAKKFDVEKGRTDCTPQVIQAAYYIENQTELYKVYLDYAKKSIEDKKSYEYDINKPIEDAKSFANPDNTQVYDASGKALGYSHEQNINKMSPVGKSPKEIEKVRLIFPLGLWEEIGLWFLQKFKVFTGYFKSFDEAVNIVNELIAYGVKTKELVIGSHGGGKELLITQSEDENFTFDNSFLEKIKQIITPSTKVFFTACHGADDLEMLKDAAEKLGVGAYAASGVYNYITNEAEKGFFYCSANPVDRSIGGKIEQPIKIDSGTIEIKFKVKGEPYKLFYTIQTKIFGPPITITEQLFFSRTYIGGSDLYEGEFLIESSIDLEKRLVEYIFGYSESQPENQDVLKNAWIKQSEKTPEMFEYLQNQFLNGKIDVIVNGLNVKSYKPFLIPKNVNNKFLLKNGYCKKVNGPPVSWVEP